MQALLETLRFLRSDQGCPWDREQSLADLCRYLIDEAYEFQDAVREGDDADSAEELGDVLFLILSCSLILQERGGPDVAQIASGTREKIIRRHPHVFGDRQARDAEEGERHWREIKATEARSRGDAAPKLLDGLPRSLPPLRRALTLQRRVASVGFEWETAEQVHRKLIEETEELQDVLQGGDPHRIEDELGDMLFSVVNLARFLGVDPERALRSTVDKFARRFAHVEERLRQRQRSLEAASLEEMDALWEEAKAQEDHDGRKRTREAPEETAEDAHGAS
jgi:MazG family protein